MSIFYDSLNHSSSRFKEDFLKHFPLEKKTDFELKELIEERINLNIFSNFFYKGKNGVSVEFFFEYEKAKESPYVKVSYIKSEVIDLNKQETLEKYQEYVRICEITNQKPLMLNGFIEKHLIFEEKLNKILKELDQGGLFIKNVKTLEEFLAFLEKGGIDTSKLNIIIEDEDEDVYEDLAKDVDTWDDSVDKEERAYNNGVSDAESWFYEKQKKDLKKKLPTKKKSD